LHTEIITVLLHWFPLA